MSLRFHAEVASSSNKSFSDFKKIYKESFPKKQRIPTWILFFMAKRKKSDFLFLFDEDQIVGFTFLVEKNNLTYVLYLAVNQNLRSCGYGRKSIELIKSLKPNQRIVLNLEAIDEKSSNNEQRIRRKQFYLKNGFKETNIQIISMNEVSDTLTLGGDLSMDEFESLFVNVFTWRFVLKLLRIKIVLKSENN